MKRRATTAEAVRWFTTAAERFRRPQWKQKAEEGLVRLGAPIPATPAAIPGVAVSETTAEPVTRLEPIIAEFSEEQPNETGQEMSEGEQESVFEQPPAAAAALPAAAAQQPGPARTAAAGVADAAAGAAATRACAPQLPQRQRRLRHPLRRPCLTASRSRARFQQLVPRHPRRLRNLACASRNPRAATSPPLPVPRLSARVRSGDPALSSRMAQLESQLRRLLACSIHSLEQADEAPAGPGVFLITDTDQTTYYYAEACQTLRVGIGNMLRSGRGSREGSNLKEKLAEHLGINEARVGKYLKDHCGVRWLQLDEGAPLLAHFAVAVLRPISNE